MSMEVIIRLVLRGLEEEKTIIDYYSEFLYLIMEEMGGKLVFWD
jgi:hypothetical protein